jgi:hypothetical protein
LNEPDIRPTDREGALADDTHVERQIRIDHTVCTDELHRREAPSMVEMAATMAVNSREICTNLWLTATHD